MGSQWAGMGRELMTLEPFARAIRTCNEALLPFGLNLVELIREPDDNTVSNPLLSAVCIIAIQVSQGNRCFYCILYYVIPVSFQIALTDLLKILGVEPDGMLGHSVGELACGYADGCLTAEEAVLCAYWRGRCLQEANLAPGAMAAVGNNKQ